MNTTRKAMEELMVWALLAEALLFLLRHLFFSSFGAMYCDVLLAGGPYTFLELDDCNSCYVYYCCKILMYAFC